MRIVPFPSREEGPPDQSVVVELEAALSGDARGPAGEAWCRLRDDVRALALPMSPEFQHELHRRIAERSASRPSLLSTAVPRRAAASAVRTHRGGLIAAAGAIASVVIVALVILVGEGADRGGSASRPVSAPATSGRGGGLHGQSEPVPSATASPATAQDMRASDNPAAEAASAGTAPTTAPGRVQQLGASLDLATEPAQVQVVADRVGRLAVSGGGYVQSSHVAVQQGSAGEATLMLRLPSAKLSGELVALSRLAAVHAESQSSQDITGSLEAARRQLGDALAERQALLRALARARTQGQIDSLREQLSQAGSTISQARAGLESVSRRAGTAEVEVTVQGDGPGAKEGLTLDRGLHDAGRVLSVTAVVLVIACASVLPALLLLVLAIWAWRRWRRLQREQALDGA